VIAGIRTTIPFFSWLLEQPDFLAGEFHTAYLDEVLAGRNGRPFVEVEQTTESVAAIAAALRVVLSPDVVPAVSDGTSTDNDRRWRTFARTEGLR
jgi:acetyl/propionyl-CoA carboxylase alpha subunit